MEGNLKGEAGRIKKGLLQKLVFELSWRKPEKLRGGEEEGRAFQAWGRAAWKAWRPEMECCVREASRRPVLLVGTDGGRWGEKSIRSLEG